ncbi:MAG: aconitase X swivel domain-containing protein [Planctomycetota bacterium]|jgi:predicted aconitase with swiveling domain
MAKKTFKGRPVLSGELKGKALVSKQPFNLTASFLKNMFAGETKTAPCTDSANKELYEKDLKGTIICTPQTVGSTMGAGTIMMLSELGVQPQAWLFSSHIDSISAGGLIMDDVWNKKRIITIDLLGDEFLEAVKTGDAIAIHEDGTVEVG